MKDHYSSTYDRAPMPYTLRLTNDGVSIHGNNVLQGYASHGCVGVPNGFARRLFDQARVGDEVFILGAKPPRPKKS
jgi:lipoprotein-anchoring transpeptidase ErfK/SrfK